MGDTYSTYSESKLEAAFDQVRNPKDWRAPIDTWILKKDFPVISAAIVYYTATSAVVIDETEKTAHIRAIGYRAGPAGDN